MINGIDLTAVRAGDELELSLREAEMLIAEGWAAPVEHANDKPPRATVARRNRRRPRPAEC
jgi:hypothetical protein